MNKPITFLLIDDDEDDRDLFQLALKDTDTGSVCITAGTCKEALGLLLHEKLNPDYIFLDLNMPEMSGRECLSELKKNIFSAGIPVYIFSTSSDPRDVTETKQEGAAGFISKPAKVSELTDILRSFIKPLSTAT